jgi:hypothetical protein
MSTRRHMSEDITLQRERRLEIPMAVKIYNFFLRVMTQCSLVGGDRFGEVFYPSSG